MAFNKPHRPPKHLAHGPNGPDAGGIAAHAQLGTPAVPNLSAQSGKVHGAYPKLPKLGIVHAGQLHIQNLATKRASAAPKKSRSK